MMLEEKGDTTLFHVKALESGDHKAALQMQPHQNHIWYGTLDKTFDSNNALIPFLSPYDGSFKFSVAVVHC
jgi:hypothetical protein